MSQVPDEFIARYQGLSHKQLYTMLAQGAPGQVEDIAGTWSTLRDTVHGLATQLSRDLARLAPTWDSAAGREYQHRIEVITGFAESLAAEFDAIQTGLSSMAGSLATAQSRAEDPAATDDNDKAISGAASGAAVGSVFGPPGTVVGGVVGGLMGHEQDEQEKENARLRMVQLVAGLAAEYAVAGYGTWPIDLVDVPTDLPVGDPGTTVDPTAASTNGRGQPPPTTTPGAPPSTKDTDPSVTTEPWSDELGAPADGSSAVPSGTALLPSGAPEAGTSLLGAGPAGPVGAGGLGPTGLGPAGVGAQPAGGAMGSSGLFGAGLAGATAFGGPASAAGPRAGGSSLTGARGHLVGGEADPVRSAATRTGSGGQRGAAGRGHGDDGDEPAEHLTWLTEDEMVWGDDDPAAPSVLGAAPPPARP